MQNQLKQRIMRRVYLAWFMREMLPKMAGQAAALGLLLLGVHEFISVKFVLANALDAVSGIPTLMQFFAVAFRNTGFVPQILLVSSILLGALLLRDAVRAARRIRANTMLILGASRSRI